MSKKSIEKFKQENPDYYTEYGKKWRSENPDYHKEYNAKWRLKRKLMKESGDIIIEKNMEKNIKLLEMIDKEIERLQENREKLVSTIKEKLSGEYEYLNKIKDIL